MEKFTNKEPEDKNEGISRRDFLKLGLGAAVGAIAIEGVAYGEEVLNKHVEHEGVSFNGDEAHKSGNAFADKVGNALKENWKNSRPSKVKNPRVKISMRNTDGKTEFKFTWQCDIENCEAKDADRYFDRRGTLLCGKTLEEAKLKVEAELGSSNKVNEMMQDFDRVYGKHKMPLSFVSESHSQSADGIHWYVKEFFCTAY